MNQPSPRKVSRRRFVAAASAVAASPLILKSREARAAIGPTQVRVTVHPEALHSLPMTQYGHFIEHLGKCIKGGMWAPGEEPDMFLGGVRRELLAAVSSIHPSLIRYPGGCFADGYHWQDGVGPREERPVKPNRAWGKLGPQLGPLEDNQFGTDEFCRFCEAVGAEPMLTANLGSGTAQEAAQWVEYVNGSASTEWGARRAANGHAEPYGVKYWFVGNEIFGKYEIGWKTPPEYVKVFLQFADQMRRVDPTIKLIAVGDHFSESDARSDVNRVVLAGAGAQADYLSTHQYAPGGGTARKLFFSGLNLHKTNIKRVYYDAMGSLGVMASFLERQARDSRTFSPAGKQVPIAFDEWNLWYNFAADIEQANYCLRDGVWTAAMLNLLHRHAPDVPISNIAQMVNCLGIINSSPEGTFLTPSALAFKLYTEQAGDELLPSEVEGPSLPRNPGLPMVDVSATRRGDRVALFLVNLHKSAWVDLQVDFEGFMPAGEVEALEIYHVRANQYNTVKDPQAVTIQKAKARVAVEDHALMTSLNPHSVTCLSFPVRTV